MISTHVLDTTRGRPAAGIPVTLACRTANDGWTELGRATTDADGRVKNLVDGDTTIDGGVYRLTFDVDAYQRGFYPQITLTFRVENPAEHYHVPLLLGAYGYTTYRGS
jgi:5-hydroxyisourate hydrolase